MEQQLYQLKRSSAFVSATLMPLSALYKFHSLEHTRGVVRAARIIGRASQLTAEQLDAVMIAAWFHDIGYVDGVDGHEERSASIAAKMLTVWVATGKKIADVSRSILATRFPQNPNDILGMVLCDADLSHLASARYGVHMSNLRKEQEAALGIKVGLVSTKHRLSKITSLFH